MPSVSPDGKFVAFAAQTLQRLQFWEFQIHVLDLATGKTRALDNSGGACWPSWSPDGRRSPTCCSRRSRRRSRSATPTARGAREVAADPKRWPYYPDWSKDGKWIALSVSPQHHEGEDWDLAIVPADGSASAAQADDGPRQRPLAGLETVKGTCHIFTRYNLCDVEPGARRSSCHPLISGCSQIQAVQAIDKLKPCTGYDTPVDAYCGTLKVYENRATKQGRQIDLNIVVLPALRADAQPDPLFFLAGGPGQGAAKLAKVVREIFQRVQSDRDIVLVDQRGTGKSNPLDCNSDDDSLQAIMETNEQVLERSEGLPGEIRRRPDALHDADRDGRSRRCPRVSRLRQDQRLRRLVRHARRARLHAPARRSRAVGDPRRRRAAQHAAAALLPARHAARVRAPRQGLRQRRGLQQGVSEPARAHARADRSPGQEPADREGHASAHRRDG